MQLFLPAQLNRNPRQPYLALLLAEMQQALAYPAGVLLDIITSLLSIATVYYLWQAVFSAQPQIAGFDWRAMQGYVLVSNALFALFGATSLRAMMDAIRTGAIATELLHPYSLISAQLARALGRALTYGAWSAAATLAVGFGLARMAAPPTLADGALFALSVGLSFLLSFLLNSVLALLCFWTADSEGLLWAYGTTSYIFSGGLVPLAFLPRWAQALAFALPFQGLIHTPLRLYTGTLTAWEAALVLGAQALWVGLLSVGVQLLWRRALRAAELPGG